MFICKTHELLIKGHIRIKTISNTFIFIDNDNLFTKLNATSVFIAPSTSFKSSFNKTISNLIRKDKDRIIYFYYLLATPTDVVLSKVKHALCSSIGVDRRITGNV